MLKQSHVSESKKRREVTAGVEEGEIRAGSCPICLQWGAFISALAEKRPCPLSINQSVFICIAQIHNNSHGMTLFKLNWGGTAANWDMSLTLIIIVICGLHFKLFLLNMHRTNKEWLPDLLIDRLKSHSLPRLFAQSVCSGLWFERLSCRGSSWQKIKYNFMSAQLSNIIFISPQLKRFSPRCRENKQVVTSSTVTERFILHNTFPPKCFLSVVASPHRHSFFSGWFRNQTSIHKWFVFFSSWPDQKQL